jgi:hypothetical protein
MSNDIYEVTRDEYAGFIGQLNKQMMDVEQSYQEDMTIVKIKSKNTGIHLCTRIIPEEGEEHYFVFNMPADDERVAPKPVLKITLDNKEDVQTFFNALNKLQQEKNNDRDI